VQTKTDTATQTQQVTQTEVQVQTAVRAHLPNLWARLTDTGRDASADD
jgi:hypothetical protein